MDGMGRGVIWRGDGREDGVHTDVRRRRWPVARKAAIVAESFAAGAKVSEPGPKSIRTSWTPPPTLLSADVLPASSRAKAVRTFSAAGVPRLSSHRANGLRS